MNASTLREALDGDLPLPRKTWPKLIRLLRARKKRTGAAPVLLGGNGDLQRVLTRPARGQVGELRELLRGMHVAPLDDEEWQERAGRVDRLFAKLSPRVRTSPVSVRVEGWHPSMPSEVRTAVLGRPPASLDAIAPSDAAVLVHELDGLDLGGSPLRVATELDDDEVLPAPPRERRGGPRRRGEGSWLPHTDAIGAWSTTPRHIADAHAQILVETGVGGVIDLFCGCGADTARFAEAGLHVVAVEKDPRRATLARRNATSLRVARHVAVHEGDGLALWPGLRADHPDAALFLDPPWGGAEGGHARERVVRRWETLLRGAGSEDASILLEHRAPILLKLPRDFALESLPGGAEMWQIRWHLGTPGSNAERVVKSISALRR